MSIFCGACDFQLIKGSHSITPIETDVAHPLHNVDAMAKWCGKALLKVTPTHVLHKL